MYKSYYSINYYQSNTFPLFKIGRFGLIYRVWYIYWQIYLIHYEYNFTPSGAYLGKRSGSSRTCDHQSASDGLSFRV
jgi:hypothetical protein